MRFEELNKIPVKTARRQGVNSVSVEMDDLKINEFKNFSISGDENVSISKLEKNNKYFKKLKYGVKEELIREADESFTNGFLIEVKENSKIKENVILNFNLDEDNSTLIDNIIILAKKNSEANVIINYNSNDLGKYHNGVLRIFAEEDSSIKVSKINMLGKNVTSFDSNISFVKENANVDFIAIELGAKNNVSNYEAKLEEKNSKADINVIYTGIDEEKIDMNYVVTIEGENSRTNMNIKGALKDKAVKTFKGTLDFKKGAKKSKGVEEEYCMLLSEKARSKAIPLLLCDEDDVSGEHAASSGRIDENKLFYLMSRGISYNEAKLLIINAAFNPIIDKIESEEIQNKILEKIREILKEDKL